MKRGACTYLAQILTADKAETDPQVPNRQSETRDIQKMRFHFFPYFHHRAPSYQSFYDSFFLSGLQYLLYTSCPQVSFSLYCSCSWEKQQFPNHPQSSAMVRVPCSRHQWQNSVTIFHSFIRIKTSGNWKPTPVFLPENSQGPRSLVGLSPWSGKRVGHNLGVNNNKQDQTFGLCKLSVHTQKQCSFFLFP